MHFSPKGSFILAFAARDLSYLRRACLLTDDLLRQFYDRERGLFYLWLGERRVRLPIRPVSYQDSAIPSGLSVACLNLLRLSGLFASSTGAPMPQVVRYREIAESTWAAGGAGFAQSVRAVNVCAALDLLTQGLLVTVIVDPSLRPATIPAPARPRSYGLRTAATSPTMPSCSVTRTGHCPRGWITIAAVRGPATGRRWPSSVAAPLAVRPSSTRRPSVATSARPGQSASEATKSRPSLAKRARIRYVAAPNGA